MSAPSASAAAARTAVVTGGTRGIGRAISLELARRGYSVVALYGRDRAAADALVREAEAAALPVRCVRGDLTHPDKFQAVVDDIKASAPTIDALIHCAASGVHRKAEELSVKQLSWTLELNVLAAHRLVTELAGRIPPGGRIIAITSSGGTRVIPYYAAVGASKGALEALFRHYASELAPKGISVNCVCPGLVLTDAVDAFPDKDARVRRATDATPTGRLTTPADVAAVVAFLCTAAAAQIVGQTIVVDGGKTLGS